MDVIKETWTYDSKHLNEKVSIGTIRPKRIEKVLLLLHGYDSSFEVLDHNLPLSEYAYDNRMLIVVPNMQNRYYISSSTYNIVAYFVLELFPYIRSRFELEDEPWYIAGISMGGYGSLLLGSKLADQFARIISISGAFIAHDVAIGNPEVVGSPDNRMTFSYFKEVFAPLDKLEGDPSRDPVEAALACKADIFPEVIMTCGTDDMLFSRNTAVIQEFEKSKIKYNWRPICNGKHDYTCFDEGLRYAFTVMDA